MNCAIIGIEASQPVFNISSKSLSFIAETSTASNSRSISIHSTHHNDSITVTVTSSFEISTDDSVYSTTQALDSAGGTFFVRYQPAVSNGSEYGYVVVTSGSIIDTIFLKGTIYSNDPYCLPPENLNISSQDLHNISLDWETPAVAPDPKVLTWSSNPSYSLGFNADYTKIMLQRYCDTDLVTYNNRALTSISFYARPSATAYKAVVYKGGNTNGGYNPGTLMLMQDIDLDSLNYNAWNTVILDTPVIVNTDQELWFGIYVEATGGNKCLSLSTHSEPTKGCILGTYDASGAVTCVEYSRNFSFCVRGTIENIQTITNFEVSRDDSLIGSTTGNSFQDSLDDCNTHTYTVTANWSNGCNASVESLYTNIAQIVASPGMVSFFTNYGFNQSIKKVSVIGNGLTETITALVSDHFLISTDSINFSSSVTLPTTGGNLFVKYLPTYNNPEFEPGSITFTSENVSTHVELNGQCFAECNPPQNLIVSNFGNTTDLSWEAPANQIIQQEELTWYGSNAYTNYGSSYALKRYFVYRFDTTDLSAYHGKRLTAISFYPNESATKYKIVVYQGGGLNGSYYLYSGTQIVEQNVNISSLTMNTWNTIQLDEPVIIDAFQELWYGIYTEAPAGSYTIRMSYPYVSKKGAITKTTTSSDYNWYEYVNENYCLTLKATIEDDPISLTHYKIDRNKENLGVTANTNYSDSIIYNGNYNYDVWAVWSNGCRAPLHGSVKVIGLCDPQGSTFTETACNTYDWHDTTYTESGSYHYLSFDGEGCPIIDTLNLTIHHSTHNIESDTACESFEWHGQTYTQSGTYTYAYTNADGCASIDTLLLTINYGTHNVEVDTACESFTWHGQTYTQSGTYTYAYNNTDDCPSVDTLHLTLKYGIHFVETETACDSFTWRGQTYTQSGIYTYAYNNANGCMNVDTLKLTVYYGTNNIVTETACESFEWHGQTYTQSGTYTYAYTNADGCASIDTLLLTINYGTHNVEVDTACESFTWHGQTYTQSGTYTYAYNNTDDCPSVDTLYLTINPTHSVFIHDTVMLYQEYIFNGQTIPTVATGSFSYVFQIYSTEGCDSIIHLVLYVMNNEGVPTDELTNIKVFPNPTQTLLNIKGENMQQLLIYNADGQIVYSTTDYNLFNLKKVDVTAYATGQYYIIIVLADGRTVTKKVVIKHK